MSKLNTRNILFAIFMIAVISLSCGPPRFISKGVDLGDEALLDLTTNYACTYETVGGLANFSDIEEIEDQCTPGVYGKPGGEGTLKFEDNKLIISDETGERTYVYQNFGKFCRELDDGKIECVYDLANASYRMSVYENKDNLQECFSGQASFNRIDQPQMTESQLEDADESHQDEEQSEAEDTAEEPSDSQESSDSDFLICIPKPEEYTLGIIDLTDHSSDVKRHCNADGVFTNNSDRDLMFVAYRVHNYGGWDYEKWDGPGYQVVKPGETVEYAEFYRCTGGNCGDGAWYYFSKISILYYTPECLEMASAQEEKTPESIIEIENPCDW